MSTSKIFFHSANHGIGDLMNYLDSAGLVFSIKAIDNPGFAVEAATLSRESNVPHNILLRFTAPGDLLNDIPDYRLPPEAAATTYWLELLKSINEAPELQPYKDLIWIETVNEPRTQFDPDDPNWSNMHPVDWLGQFGFHLAQLALAGGLKICLFGMNNGTPEPSDWRLPGMRMLLELAAAYPNRVAISLHEAKIPGYGDDPTLTIDSPPEDYSPHLVGRFQSLLDACDGMAIGWPTIFISEWAWSPQDIPGKEIVERDIDWLARFIAEWKCIRGLFLWNLHPQGWGGIGDKLKNHIPFVINYTLATELPEPGENPPPQPVPPVNYKVVAHLPPQTLTRAEYDLIADDAIPLKQSVVFSADDAARLVAPGLLGSKVIAWWPERWTDDIVAWLNGKGVTTVETRPLSPTPTPEFRLSSPVKDIPLAITSGGQFNAYRDYDDPRYKAHEGLDLRGVNASGQPVKVVAAAAGIVDGIRRLDPGTGYGIYIRVKTIFEGITYTLWYGHLDNVAAALTIGQAVTVGQELGLAGNTGNSFGIHLHLTVQKVPGGLPGYIVDNVIDPAPLLGLPPTTLPGPGDEPEPEPTYKYNGPPVVFSPALHAPGSDWEWGLPQVQSLYDKVKLPVKWLSNGVSASYWGRFNKPSFHLIRVFWKANEKKTPQQAWDQDIRDGVLSFYANGGRNFELLNEPNIEGVNVNWSNGDELGVWLSGLATIIKGNCPEARLYFPGMSPGVPWTNQFTWTNKAWAIAKPQCYGFCMHTYTGIVNDEVAAANEIVTQVKELQAFLNLQVPLAISESSVNRAAAPDYKARVYRRVENALKTVPGIQAICWFVSSWSDAPSGEDGNQESWVKYGIGDAYVST